MALILASGSPRRLELLRQLGIEPVVRPADIDESVHDGEAPDDYVRRIALGKANTVLAEPDHVVLAADTTVIIDGLILGKPVDEPDTRAMLHRLSGRRHVVLTAVTIRTMDHTVTDVEESTVTFSPLSDQDIEWYVLTGEPADKAGAYGVQGAGGLFVSSIDGSTDNIIGLPRALTARLFDDLGLRLLDFSQFGA
ncbi:MAG: septum formation inhibitor Maf [Acidimicrobiales bacterium]|nr:septum formation inhibitor Maf [Acidimicrobiales bacterium]RZV48855.1 MAG: septum formation inhibitor Maf [Acidimicrobiales bacterium]